MLRIFEATRVDGGHRRRVPSDTKGLRAQRLGLERGMTQLLEHAIFELNKLPPDEQDAMATLILETLEDEERLDHAFAASEDKWKILADKVREDTRAGRTQKMGIA